MATAGDYREHLDEVLEDNAETVAYLNAALVEEDPEVFLLALRDVARSRQGGLAALAETAQLDREHFYQMLSENGNREFRSLKALLDALGFRLSVALKATGRPSCSATGGIPWRTTRRWCGCQV
jgi:probable addiction module antidote protein